MNSAAYRFPCREDRWKRSRDQRFDVAVIGGGINGAGIALDLTLRGLSVALFERDDYASATSSASSRLIHGGLRYLEHYQFGFVRESLRERAILRRLAPDLVRVEPFFFALRNADRVHPLMLRCGMWLYGALALPHPWIWPHAIPRSRFAEVVPGADPSDLKGLFTYADGATHDARLVFSLITEAARRGAVTLSRAEVESLDSGREHAKLTIRDRIRGEVHDIHARCAVLAAGPFTDLARKRFGLGDRMLSTTRGTHIVVDRDRLPLPEGSIIFTSPIDGRVMFLLRWDESTAIGTTDLDADPDPTIAPTRAEVEYLLGSANALIPSARLDEQDVRTAVAGLRPLLRSPDDAAGSRSREERIDRTGNLFTVAGGKLTGFRAIAERLGRQIVAHLRSGTSGDVWTGSVVIPDATRASRSATQAFLSGQREAAQDSLRTAIECEEILTPADLLLRRSDLVFRGVSTTTRALEFIDEVLRAIPITAESSRLLATSWRREFALREAWRNHPRSRAD